jgi:putative RNA 2'-phosphotransferase
VITRADVEAVVARNEKQRFALSEDGQFIRANQGHSVAFDLGLQPKAPPEQLFHGITFSSLPSIKQEGLRPMKRQHVHLSADHATARAVGQRHGKPVVLTVDAGHLHRAGQRCFVSENGVWLTDAVAPDHIGFPSASGEV